MKKIWKALVTHWKEDFSPMSYLGVGAFLIVLLTLNYTYDFEDSYLDSLDGAKKFFAYLLFYSIPYFVVVLILGKSAALKHPAYLLKILFALTVLSLDASLPFVESFLSQVPYKAYIWSYKVTVNIICIVTVLMPLFLYYRFFEKSDDTFYGLSNTRFDFRPYWLMLAIMLPLILLATTNASFLKQYPMYRITDAHDVLGVGEWVTVLGYELAYGLDFITVELLFRGFFVIGMMTFLGRRSVLAMAVIYCMLHFGKPAGEAVSSVVGGYILGVIAFEYKSIWGGVMVHLGIAWMMEVVSYLVKQL